MDEAMDATMDNAAAETAEETMDNNAAQRGGSRQGVDASALLGQCPVEGQEGEDLSQDLFGGKQGEWEALEQEFWEVNPEAVPKRLKDIPLCRVDQILDLYIDTQEEAEAWVSVLSRSVKSRGFKAKECACENAEEAAEGETCSLRLCSCAPRKGKKKCGKACKSCETMFCAYSLAPDAIDTDASTPVLRLRLSSRKKALIRRLGLKKGTGNKALVRAAGKRASKTIRNFIRDTFFIEGEILRTDEALRCIGESAESEKRKDQMRCLVASCVVCGSLIRALEAMELNSRKRRKLLERFTRLGISPVTLGEDSPFSRMDSIRSLLTYYLETAEEVAAAPEEAEETGADVVEPTEATEETPAEAAEEETSSEEPVSEGQAEAAPAEGAAEETQAAESSEVAAEATAEAAEEKPAEESTEEAAPAEAESGSTRKSGTRGRSGARKGRTRSR